MNTRRLYISIADMAVARITNTKVHSMSSRSLARRALPVISLSDLLHRVAEMGATRRQRRALARLDAAALADIGITAAQAMTEARRPVWDVAPGRRA